MKKRLETLLQSAIDALKISGELDQDIRPNIQVERTRDAQHGDFAYLKYVKKDQLDLYLKPISLAWLRVVLKIPVTFYRLVRVVFPFSRFVTVIDNDIVQPAVLSLSIIVTKRKLATTDPYAAPRP